MFQAFHLAGFDPAIVGLVIREPSHHQFGIGSVFIRQDLTIPHMSVLAWTPLPELCSFHNMVVAHMYGTRISGVVIPAHKILLQVIGKDGDGIGMVLPPAHIDLPGVIFSIINLIGDGPVYKAVFCMIYALVYTGWEDGLVIFIHMGRHVGPVENGMGMFGRIEHPDFRLNVTPARAQGQSYAPFHAVPGLNFSKPDGLAAITVLHKPVVHRQIGGSTVMMEYAPFYSPGNPCSKHSNIGRLNYMLAVENLIIVGKVGGIEEASPYIRQKTEFYIFIFQVYRPVLPI